MGKLGFANAKEVGQPVLWGCGHALDSAEGFLDELGDIEAWEVLLPEVEIQKDRIRDLGSRIFPNPANRFTQAGIRKPLFLFSYSFILKFFSSATLLFKCCYLAATLLFKFDFAWLVSVIIQDSYDRIMVVTSEGDQIVVGVREGLESFVNCGGFFPQILGQTLPAASQFPAADQLPIPGFVHDVRVHQEVQEQLQEVRILIDSVILDLAPQFQIAALHLSFPLAPGAF